MVSAMATLTKMFFQDNANLTATDPFLPALRMPPGYKKA
jgi:hypothetical protein